MDGDLLDSVSLEAVKVGAGLQPVRAMVIGGPGVGKTTLAVGAPKPIIIQTEDGLGTLRVPTFGILQAHRSVLKAISELYTKPNHYETLVFDSLDWYERLVWQEACRQNGWENIETPGWGKGYAAALELWQETVDGFNALRNERNMNIILISHVEIKRFEAPDTEPYDRYVIKLNKLASGLVQENVDCIFFMAQRVGIVKDKRPGQRDSDARARGAGDGSRVIHTEARPAFIAKNRYGMPAQISLPRDPSQGWAAVAQFIPYFNQLTNNANED